MSVKEYINSLLRSKTRKYTEDQILEKVYSKFPELDEEVKDHVVKKMITFSKLKNLNSLYSDFSVE